MTIDQLQPLKEELERLSNRNAHGEAMRVIASFFALDHFRKLLGYVNSIHEAVGYMPFTLGQYRTEVYAEMLRAIEREHGPEIRKAVEEA